MFEYVAFGVWAFVAKRPKLYRVATQIATRLMRAMGNEKGLIAILPMAGGWTAHRYKPVPAGKTFRELNKHR